MKKSIIKLLNLQGLLIGKIKVLEEERLVIVSCRGARVYAKCPKCKLSTNRTHQTSSRMVKHGIINLYKVTLQLSVRRFKCKHCCKVFTENFAGINRCRSSTNLIIQALSWLSRNSFNFTSQQFKLSPSTLVRYMLKIANNNTLDWTKTNITKLGIDEHSFRGKRLVITITDLSNHKLLAILKSDTQKELEHYLLQIPKESRLKINEVCTDLRPSYGIVTKKLLPKAILTADRYHTELLGRRVLDEIRTIVQDEGKVSRINLKKILWTNEKQLDANDKEKLKIAFIKYERFPILKQTWIIKEKIINIYLADNEEDALKRFNHVIMLLNTCDNSYYLNTLKKTLLKWKQPILNYFKYRTTNGFTEGCHTKIKMIKRVSFGFRNINNYIAKVTLAFLPLIYIINLHTI